jgi:acyl dehydratase
MPRLITFEDLADGSVFWGPELAADADEMVADARKYDPWPFHVDAEAAKQTPFGGLIASAGYTFSLWCQAFQCVSRTQDTEWAFLEGYELHIKLLQPVRPGDWLRLKLTIGGKRLRAGDPAATSKACMCSSDETTRRSSASSVPFSWQRGGRYDDGARWPAV